MNTYDINKIKLPNGDICNLRDQSATITKTVQNTNIIHIEDAAEKPLKECKIDIQPIQDFNGYDHPWPGGGGVNKFNPGTGGSAPGTLNGITFAKNADGSYSFSGTATKSTWFNFGNVTLPAGTWTASVTKTGSYTGTVSFGANGGAFNTYPNLTNYPRTVTSESETTGNFGINFATGVAISGTLTLRIQIESGSSATEWTPYSNICPITGWTGAKVTRTRKNLLPMRATGGTVAGISYTINEDNSITINGTSTGSAVMYIARNGTPTSSIFPPGDYIISGFPVDVSGNAVVQVTICDKNTQAITQRVQIKPTAPSKVFTVDETEYVADVFIRLLNDSVANNSVYYPQIELGSAATDYEPYQGSTYDLSFGSAGTVYGGTLDATNGVLTANKAMMVFNGTESWHVYENSNYGDSYWINVPDKMMGHNLTVCTAFENIRSCWGNDGKDRYGVFSDIGGYTRLYFKAPNANVASVENFKTWLTEHPIMVVYPLATSLIYHLTPLQVQMLLGENNIWSDTGASSCTYYVNSNLTAELAEYKKLQTQISDPVAENTATAFISSITQNVNGVITALKANLPTASTSTAGIVQLNTATDSTSTTQAATPSAVKAAYDLALTANNTLGGSPDGEYTILTSDGSNIYWGSRDVESSQVHRSAILNGTNDIAVQPLIDIARANRLMFLPADQIIIEKTVDGGQTWTRAGISDYNKTTLFWEQTVMVPLPVISNKQNTLCGLRITITAMKYNVPAGTAQTDKYNYWNSSYVSGVNRYCSLYGLYFYVNANSNTNGISIKIERAKGSSATTWQTAIEPDPSKFVLTGWSGANFVTFPEDTFGGRVTQTNKYWNYRMTFMTAAQPGQTFDANRVAIQYIGIINGYGNDCWVSANNIMMNDHIYRWDEDQNVDFPADVAATTFTGNGAGLTNLNGSNIASGTIPVARLPIEDIRAALGL